MKAVGYTKYGSPNVLLLKQVETPVPEENEVHFKIYATTGTTLKIAFRKGEPFIARFFTGLIPAREPPSGSSLISVTRGEPN